MIMGIINVFQNKNHPYVNRGKSIHEYKENDIHKANKQHINPKEYKEDRIKEASENRKPYEQSAKAVSGFVPKSATSAWRYATAAPRKKLAKTQQHTRVLEARLRVVQERNRQAMLKAQLQQSRQEQGSVMSSNIPNNNSPFYNNRSGFFSGDQPTVIKKRGFLDQGSLL
jgi:hypothetical protein